MKKYWFIACVFLVNSCFASVELILKPNPVGVDEEVQLIIKQKGSSSKDSGGLPDISLLAKDFQIVGTQQSMSYQILNGNAQQENIWTIILLPKHPGDLTIPALKIGNETTTPQILQVMKNKLPEANPNLQQEKLVFLDWSIEPQTPMLHEQIKIKLKIYHQVPLLDAKLSPPSVDNALLFSVDNHQHDVELVDRQKYEVETYEYLVYPQKIGSLLIHPPILDALQYDLMPTPIHLSLPGKKLKVNAPLQTSNGQNWLPAANLSYEELTPINQKVKLNLGETLSRRVKITGLGVPANIIPDINVTCGDQCKVYSHLLETKNKLIGGELMGTKTFEITYLPKEKGKLEIPAIEMPWFNTKTHVAENLVIPGVRVNVMPEHQTASPLFDSEPQTPSQTHHIPNWLSLGLGLMLGMILMQLLGKITWANFWRDLGQMEFKNHALKSACFKNDAAMVRVLFLDWARQHFSESFRDLHDVSEKINHSEMNQQINLLIGFLFKDEPNKVWDGKRFWQAFKKIKKIKKPSNHQGSRINSLNPLT
jgi:hypothetical protein